MVTVKSEDLSSWRVYGSAIRCLRRAHLGTEWCTSVHCIPFFYKFHAKENASVSESDVVDATKRCFVLDRRDRTLLSQIQVESDLQISNNFFPFFLAILLSHSVSLVFALLQLFCSYLFMSTMFSIKVRIPQVLIAILINVSFYV